MRLRSMFLAAVMIAVGFSVSEPAGGAEGAAPRVVYQDTVVVSSSKLQFRLADLANSATIISPLQLRRTASMSLQDPLALVPGAHIIDLSGTGTQGVVESRGFASQGFSSHTLVLVDEMPINDFEREQVDWNLLAPAQIERIEFMRGPSSFLYGNASMSGVINLVTRRPRAGASGWFQGGGGSEGQATGSGGLAWGGERARGGLSASRRRIDGYRKNSKWNATSGYGFVSAEPGDVLKLKAKLLLQRADQQVPGPLPAPDWKDDATRSDTPLDERDSETLQATVSATLAATPSTQIVVTLAADVRDAEAVETIVPAGTLRRSSRSTTVLGELRAHWKPAGGWLPHLMLGADLRDGRLESRYMEITAPGAQVGAGNVDRLSGGVFALAQLHPVERWTVTGGVRADWLRSNLDDPGNPAPKSADDDLRAFTPTLGVSFALPSGNVYASYAGSFKAPNLEQLYDQRPFTLDFDGPGGEPPFVLRLSNHALKPQRGDQVEAGVRSRIAGGLWGDAAVYYLRSRDEIGFDLANFRFSNIAKSIHYGFEGQVALAPRAGISGSLSYAWTIAEFDGGPNDGKQINTVPEHTFFGRASYDHRWNGSVTGELGYVTNQWIDEANQFELEPYAVVNLSLTQDVGTVEIFASVRNLFDRGYATLGFVTLDQFGNDLPLYFPAQSRSLRAGVRLQLDAGSF